MNSRDAGRATAAADNNMDWYGEVCLAHRIPFIRSAREWHSMARMPPFYSNLVTRSARRPLALLRHIGESVGDRAWGPGWGLKDASARHDFTNAGFEVLFEACWVHRAPGREALPDNGLAVRRMTGVAGTRAWIAAWGETPRGEVVFPTGFGDAPRISLLAAFRDGACVGGLACNASRTCIGISNLFGNAEAISACVAHAATPSNHPLVGYERDEQLTLLKSLGFAATGPLAVWIRQAA